MPQFYPDGPGTVTLNAIQENASINTPPNEDFNTPALQGSMQQILSENLGKFVIADFLVGISTLVRRAGIIYSVGRGYVTLYLEQYKAFEVCDIFSLKFVTFFPPGSEPSIDELNRGLANSGILSPGVGYTALGNMGQNAAPSVRTGTERASSGCRTLGQR